MVLVAGSRIRFISAEVAETVDGRGVELPAIEAHVDAGLAFDDAELSDSEGVAFDGAGGTGD
jgi:hypothetical protein